MTENEIRQLGIIAATLPDKMIRYKTEEDLLIPVTALSIVDGKAVAELTVNNGYIELQDCQTEDFVLVMETPLFNG